MRGALAGKRALAIEYRNTLWRAADQARTDAIRKASEAYSIALEAADAQYDADFPVQCVGCRGNDGPDCRGCPQFTGGEGC